MKTMSATNQANDEVIKRWLTELFAEAPDLPAMLLAARAAASRLQNTPAWRQFIQALGGAMEDRLDCNTCQAQLPDFLYAQQTPAAMRTLDAARFADLRTHLALCPYCIAAYVQTAEWLVGAETDTTPVAATYPAFDLTFLRDSSRGEETRRPSARVRTMLEQARQEGRRWFADAVGDLYLWFAPELLTQPAPAWALKSSMPNALVAQTVLTAEETPGWEIEVSAFAIEEDQTLCRLEVALYPLAASSDELGGIGVTVAYAATEEQRTTDVAGVAEFPPVPIHQLADVVVRIDLTAAHGAQSGRIADQ